MLLDGDIRPERTALYCVATSAVLPVTPVRVAKVPYNSSCCTPRAEARGTTLPMDEASSGKLVCPRRTVAKDRSAAFWTASALMSP